MPNRNPLVPSIQQGQERADEIVRTPALECV